MTPIGTTQVLHHDKIPSLDGLRAISIIIVVLSHCGLQHVVPGRLGVTIFFFLSGFLITTLLMSEHAKTGSISIRHFYIRRVLRLLPPLIIMLSFAYTLTYLKLLPGAISLEGFLAQLFYFANYYMIFSPGGGAVPYGTGLLWSLAVEEHFYIVYPLLLLALLTFLKVPTHIATVLGILCACILAWRSYLIMQPGIIEDRLAFASDTRADSIVFGCLLALLRNPINDTRENDVMQRHHWLLLAGGCALLLATLLIRNWHFRETVRYTIQGIALAPIFYMSIRFAHLRPFRILNTRPMILLGIWSYSIYLIHEIIVGLISLHTPDVISLPWLLVPVVLAISIGFAHIIEAFVDPYFRKLRSRFRPQAGVRTTSGGPKPYATRLAAAKRGS
jgi:peptidoglycan/LPS O-acetylase OafA/YrhL